MCLRQDVVQEEGEQLVATLRCLTLGHLGVGALQRHLVGAVVRH